MILEMLKVQPPEPNDDRQYLTDFPGEFFELCYEDVLSLGGECKILPKGSPVQIALRANNRILLITTCGFFRWADRAFLQITHSTKK